MKDRPQDTFRAIAGESAWVLGGTALIALAGAGLNLIIGNFFGSQGLGAYTLLMTVYLAAGTLAGLGMPGAVTKFATEHRHSPAVNERYLSAALLMSIPGAGLLLLILWLFRQQAAVWLQTQELATLLRIAVFGLPFFAANKMILSHLRGLRRIRAFAIAESGRATLLIGLTAVFVLIRPSLSAAALALAATEAALFFLLLYTERLQRRIRLQGISRPAHDLAGYGGKILLSRLFLELDGRIAFLIAGSFLGTKEVGVLSVAFLLTQPLTLFPAALQKVTGPVITELYLEGRIGELQDFIEKTMSGSLFILSGTALIVWWLFHPLVSLLYPGRDIFQQAFIPYGILAVGLTLRGGTGSVGSIFVSIGLPHIVMKLSPIRLFINLGLSLALVSPLGIGGIAIGSSVTGAAVFFLWILAMRHTAEIRLRPGRLLVFPVAAGLMALASLPVSGGLAAAMEIVLLLLYGILGYRYLDLGHYLARLTRKRAAAPREEKSRC